MTRDADVALPATGSLRGENLRDRLLTMSSVEPTRHPKTESHKADMPGTGNVVEAVRHMRAVMDGIRKLVNTPQEELMTTAKDLGAPFDLVVEVHNTGKLPVVNFAAGGVATPADAALMMQLGAEGVFVGSGIFKSGDPAKRAAAIVKATTFYDDPDTVARVSRGLGEAMVGINLNTLPESERLATRGW